MADNLLSDLTNEILAERQPPAPNADKLIAQETGDTQAAPMPAGPASDPPAAGPAPAGFDPDLHEADPQGNPVLTADGQYRRRRGRKPTRGANGKFQRTGEPAASQTAAGPVNIDSEQPAAVISEIPSGGGNGGGEVITREACKAAAVQFVALGVAVAMGVFGDEWAPDKPEAHPLGLNETDQMTEALTEYFYQQQSVHISPGLGLALACTMYAGRRVARPKTREILFGWWSRFKGIIGF